MSSNIYRQITILLMAGLASVTSIASAASASESDERLAEQREELFYISDLNPFPKTPIPAIDPLTKVKTDRVLAGPAFKVRGYGSEYDYYRYVTFYNVNAVKERIYELPVHREECHDQSAVFAAYSYSYTYSATITASASIEGLGLSSSLSQSRTFTTSRNLRAMGGVIAEHTPYFMKQSWEGRTFVQLLNSKTRHTDFLLETSEASPWWVSLFFPSLSSKKYPMDFEVKNADWTFQVERNIVAPCSSGFEG